MKRLNAGWGISVFLVGFGIMDGYGAVQGGGDFSYSIPGVYKKVTLGDRTGINAHSGQPITFGTYATTVTDPKNGQTHNAGDPITFTEKWSGNINYGIDLDHDDTEYTIYVPESYGTDHSDPHGIILFYSSNDSGSPSSTLIPLLEERKLIHIGALSNGNGTGTSQRIGMGLMGLLRAMELFNIDTDRIYLTGNSGGSRTLHSLSFYHPELFTGAFGVVGSGYPEYLPNCYETSSDNSHYEVGYISHFSNSAQKYYPRDVGFRYFCNTGYGDWRQGDNMNVYHFGLERNGFINRLYTAEGGHANGRTTMDFKAGIDFLEHPRAAFDASTADLSASGASAVESGQTLTLTPNASATAAAQTANQFNWCDPYGAEIRLQYKPNNNAGGVLNQKIDIGIWSKPFAPTDALPTSGYAANDRAGLILSLSHDGSSETYSLRLVQPNHSDPTMRDITVCTGEFTDWPNQSALWDSGGWNSKVNQSINTSSLDIRINAWEDEVDLVFGKHLTVENDKNLEYVDRLDDERTIRLRFNADDHHNATNDVFHTLMLSPSDWFQKNQAVLTFASQAASGVGDPGTATIQNLSMIHSGTVEVTGVPATSADPILRGPVNATVAYSNLITEITDPTNEELTFLKLEGPAWLTVATNGLLHGTPGYTNAGVNSFMIKATDPGGLFVEVDLEIDVVPYFTDPVDLSATVDVSFSDDLSTYVTGTFDYALGDGPAWLTVGTDGSLSGTPLDQDIGSNRFYILLSSGGLVQHVLALTISVAMDGVLMVDTNMDDDDTAAAQAELDGAGGMPGAIAALEDADGFSLREAIWLAEAVAGPDTIKFDQQAATWQSDTILLSTQLLISSSLEIDGGSGVTVDAGAQTFRVFEVDGGAAGADLDVLLKKLTIQNGRIDKATGRIDGAGVFNKEKLTMSHCIVRGNSTIGAAANWAKGIGISNEDGVLQLEHCQVVDNFSMLNRSVGIGVYSYDSGTVRIINSVVANNTTAGGTRSDKPGVWMDDSSSLVMLNSSVYGNSTVEVTDTPGLFVSVNASAKVISSVIAGNLVGSSTVGATNVMGPATLYNCLISDDVGFGGDIVDGGGNLTGAAYASEVFDGSVANSGTDVGAVAYTDGGDYYNHDGSGAHTRVTPATDSNGNGREQGSSIDIGAYEIVVNSNPDSDGDGIPDAWELAHGLSPSDPLDADGNADGDGLTNLEEFQADTNPTNAGSCLMISAVQVINGNFNIQWQGGREAVQHLEHASNLWSNDWTVLHTLNPPTDPDNSWVVTNEAASPVGFFRIRSGR
ncbi:hypothetical protein PDESU_04896 [Pontiella desulfatans]|uniref:Right handed beta helix domain-containing protein n=1 Tax=Pontiella desulfatans TaxID=2750659 RepID=A0A6C2U8M1_PONDE|nr:choice-of-anchor Q domain-containing protein [Pontiella desulfatans]VGO16305.1 hypothetical protein PDESU_04896 [Pontiella desulfatans]